MRLRTAVDDFGVVVDLDEVGLLDHGKGDAEGVHPEGCWVDLRDMSVRHVVKQTHAGRTYWVTDRDMASDALIEAELAENAEGQCKSALEVFPFFVFVLELRRSRELQQLCSGVVFCHVRLIRCSPFWLSGGCTVACGGLLDLGFGCGWWSHGWEEVCIDWLTWIFGLGAHERRCWWVCRVRYRWVESMWWCIGRAQSGRWPRL